MGMALYSEESVSTSPPWSPSSCSKKAVLKNSLSQMKSLFCKEIDSHLKKLRASPSLTPSPKKKTRELRAENGEEEGVSRWPLKDQLRRSCTATTSPPLPPRSIMSPNKRKGKENVSLVTSKRRRLTTEVVSITSSSSSSTSISTLVNGNNSVHEQSEFNHYSTKLPDPLGINSLSLKPLEKAQTKFDPSRVRRPDDDPVPPSNNGIKSRKKVFKKKLDMDDVKDTSASVFIPVNRKANIVPGDYRSHGREYFHVRSNSKITYGEPESEESYQWLPDLMHRQIDEFLDLNNGEKELIKLWNEHMLLDPAYGSEMLSNRLKEFVEKERSYYCL
ncbi:SUZ12 [Lepeophtheirus salmonis]|uniref:SUZ12 n=1 Tax=Lepeophtheirus salmonis TaxID=72036 RepID=A0A7R8D0I7_LEPSM|nr:SUZ12 [Lepeophtheirus salmonis]CAF2984491.1 SUZ12 [Lepeophtheirus salmonis]